MNEHRIPAVDRAIQVLGELEKASKSLSLRELCSQLKIPRSTVYRLLNSLEAGGLVIRQGESNYVLGPRLLQMAKAVPQGFDLVAITRSTMDNLATRLDATVKLSVLDANSALVVAMAATPATYSVTTQVGRRFPLHAGASSKLLAAWMDPEQLRRALPEPLERFSERTLVRRADLDRELRRIREQGYSEDTGEYAAGVRAIAVPLFNTRGECAAALSIPFFSEDRLERIERIRDALLAAAKELNKAIGAPAVLHEIAEM